MTPENFIYWLQGFMEIADPKSMDEKQIQVIKDHISLVLKKETPQRSPSPLFDMIEKLPKNPFETKGSGSPFITMPQNTCVLCGKNHGGLQCPSMTVSC